MIVRKYLLIRHSTTWTLYRSTISPLILFLQINFHLRRPPLETLSKRLPTRIRTLKIAKVCIILRTHREENQVKFTHGTTSTWRNLHTSWQKWHAEAYVYVVSPLESWWPSCALTVVDSLSIFPKRLDQTTPLRTPPLPTYALTQAQPSMHAPGE